MFRHSGQMSSNVIDVGIGEIVICRKPDVLRTVLGSCVAVCLLDPGKGVAGMAHIVLPKYNGRDSKERFADTGFSILLEKMKQNGADTRSMFARLAGGARMNIIKETSPFAKIGLENARILKEQLISHNITIHSEQIGGVRGVTVRFSAETGELIVKELNPLLK